LEHAPENSGALMRPFLDRNISKMQVWDIREAQKVAGPPKKRDAPPSTPTSGEWSIRGSDWQMNAAGDIKIYRNGKLQSVKDSPFAG
jgi:hypothetical protein